MSCIHHSVSFSFNASLARCLLINVARESLFSTSLRSNCFNAKIWVGVKLLSQSKLSTNC